MPVIQFKGKTAIESYHHTIPHHTLEFDPKLSVLLENAEDVLPLLADIIGKTEEHFVVSPSTAQTK
jgi:hypothetical protein